MVLCIKCGIEKNSSEFYSHKQNSDGILHKCKDCVKEYQKSRDCREYDKQRNKDPKRIEWKKQFLNKFRAENPEKVKAQRKVSNFLRYRKDLKATKCVVCGNEGLIHYHHFDYTKPNEVIPCCPKDHSAFHRGKLEVKPEWILVLPFTF